MSYADLLSCVEALCEVVTLSDPAPLLNCFVERITRAGAALAGSPERFTETWAAEVRSELRRSDDLWAEAQQVRRQIRKGIMNERDSQAFLVDAKPFIFARDHARCVAGCPVEFKPKFDADKKKF
jgi:hypothetical protein